MLTDFLIKKFTLTDTIRDPSDEDIKTTKKLKKAGGILGIKILACYSFPGHVR